MYKVKKIIFDTPPWKTDFQVVSDDEYESIVCDGKTLEQARRIVQILNKDDARAFTWDDIRTALEREGFYL